MNTVGIIGLGYVGLPLAMRAAHYGYLVVGFDIDGAKVRELQSSDFYSPAITFTTNPYLLYGCDTIIICVPTPVDENDVPDLNALRSAIDTAALFWGWANLFILESTSYPGTTRELLLPALEAAGAVLDSNVWVAFSPERSSPGEGPGSNVRVVGGLSQQSTLKALDFYRTLQYVGHSVSSAEVAEFAKLLENSYRAVNISFINEMAQVARTMGINIWEAIEAARTKGDGFAAFYPGPGIGGHCIPVDPRYLSWRAKPGATSMIDRALRINKAQPGLVVGRAINFLGGSVAWRKILLVGLTYKAGVPDLRESAAVAVLQKLVALRAQVDALDPYVTDTAMRELGAEPCVDIKGYDLAIILTEHDDTPLDQIAQQTPLVLDTRGVYYGAGYTYQNVYNL